jgi:hypothetical protein
VDDVWLTQAGRDDLHRFGMVAVGTCADLLNTAAPIGKQGGLPTVQGVVRQRLLALFDGRLQHIERGFGARVALHRFGILKAQAPGG